MFRSIEQKHFSDLVAKHLAEKDAPLLLEGGTGLGKTRAYLAALANRDERVAIVLPTHQLIDQLMASTDLAAVGFTVEAFRPARMFETRADYTAHRAAAMESRVMLCTAASVMIDQRLAGSYNGATRRDYLLFDEADQLPQAAALQQDLTISAEDLKAAGVVLTTVEQTVENLIGKKGIEPEVRARALIIREALAEPAWYHTVGKNEDGGIGLFHRLPGRLLKRIANHGNVAFISATLTVSNSFNDFKRSMGIENASRLSGVVEPTKHGDIFVEAPLDLSPAEVIASAPKPCLVATTSHEGSSELGALLPLAVVRRRDETAGQAASRLPANGVLIAAGAWAGLDTPVRWASIVVPRIPFDRPTVLDEQVESRYIDSKNVAVRRMRQVVGRGIRTPDARCTIFILDERYKSLGQFLPERFKDSWIEGGRDIDKLLTAESRRSRAIRPKALGHYGCKCYACDLVPPHPSIIEIHHLRPIAEGERQTVLEDVIPLCANCHRLAHTQQPPLPIDDLRKRNKSGLHALPSRPIQRV
jgi:Rad3-related DNA helicase